MKDKSSILKLRFVGEGISPSSFTAKELGELLVELQKSMAALVDSYGDSRWTESEHLFSLVEIKDESNGLYFSSDYPKADNVYFQFTNALKNKSLFNLPRGSFSGIKLISKFTDVKNCNAEISFDSGSKKEFAVITPEDKLITPEEIYLKDTREFYGEITRIGGTEPRVRFKTFDGKTYNGDLSKELAKKIADKLYQTVKITAEVKWLSSSTEMEIRVKSVRDFKIQRNQDLFKNLSDSLGSYSDNYGNDPNKIIKD